MISTSTLLAAVNATDFGAAIDPVMKNIVNPIIGFMFALGIVVFTYGVLTYVWGSEDGDARKKAKMSMLSGVIGMFIMMSAWGVVYLVSNTLKTL